MISDTNTVTCQKLMVFPWTTYDPREEILLYDRLILTYPVYH